MPRTPRTSSRPAGSAARKCFVRVDDNMVYGPVPLSTVSEWAEQGRVTAGNEVSFDKENWVRADTLPELKLEWTARTEGGEEFGPFNLRATANLVQRGLIPGDGTLVHRATGEKLGVREAVDAGDRGSRPPETSRGRAKAADGEDELVRLAQDLSSNVRKRARQLGADAKPARKAGAPAEQAAARSDVARLTAELGSEQARRLRVEERAGQMQADTEALAQRVARLEHELAEARTQAAQALGEREAVRAELRQAVQREQDAAAKLTNEAHAAQAARDEVAALRTRIKALEDDARSSTDLLERAMLELQKQKAESRKLKESMPAAAVAVPDVGPRVSELEAELAAARGQAAEQATRVRTLEAERTEWRGRMDEVSQAAAQAAAARAAAEVRADEQARVAAQAAAEAGVAQAGLAERVAGLETELAAARARADELGGSAERAAGEHAAAQARLAERERAWQARTEAAVREAREDAERQRAALIESLQARNAGLVQRMEDLEAERDALRARAAGKPGAAWFLRLDDGSECGPVPTETLRDWAAQCRVGPSHEVSADRETWVPAREVAELELEWMVTLEEGTRYGPLHLLAVRDLVGDGSVKPDSEIENARTGERRRADSAVAAEVVHLKARNAELAAAIERTEAAACELAARIAPLEAQLDRALCGELAPPKQVRRQFTPAAP